MFCEFQIFSLYGTGGMGLRRRKMIKTSKKSFSLDPQKHVEFFCLQFLKVSDMVEFCMRNEFSAVFCSLSTGRWTKPLFWQQDCFFPARHHKHAFKTTKDVSSNKLAYNILRVVVASAVREVSQKSQRKANIFTSGSINCGTNFLQIFLPTVFGERALPLYILKLPGRPRQGLSSIPPPKNTLFRCTYGVDKNDFCILQIFRWIPNLFEHKVHQNIICTSCKRYCIHIKKKSSKGIKPQLQSRC